MDELHFIWYFFLLQLKAFFPYWIIGLITGSFLSVFGSAKIEATVAGLDTAKFSIGGTILASLLGAVSPLCMYGTVPLVAALGRKGLSEYLIAAFMVSSILINPNLFIFSFALGAPLALTRLFLSLAAGIIAGTLIYLFFKTKKFFHFDNFERQTKPKPRLPAVMLLLDDFYRAVRITGPYLIAGLLLTSIFERYLSQELVKIAFGNYRGLGIILAASLGVPIYVCGGGTIPILKGWLDSGMEPGAAVAFMITGPATKVTNLSAVKIILGIKNLILFIAFNFVFAILSGILIDWIYLIVSHNTIILIHR